MKAATQEKIMFVIGTLFCVAIGYGIGELIGIVKIITEQACS